MGNLTNTQAAYRLYNDRFMAGLQQRAQDLWADGYRVMPLENDENGAVPPTAFLVYKHDEDPDAPIDNGYAVDPLNETCTCPFFLKQADEPLTDDGMPVPCKHLLGLDALVKEEIAYWNMKANYTADYRREIEYVRIIRGLAETLKRIGK